MAIDQKVEINKNGQHVFNHESCDAIILFPSLGCPSLVKIENKEAWAEMIIAAKTEDLRLSEIAFHLRYAEWGMLHGGKKDQNDLTGDVSTYSMLDMYSTHFSNHTTPENADDFIIKSSAYINTDDRISEETVKNDTFKIQLAHINAFPWVLELYRNEGYKYIYKIKVNLKHEPSCINAVDSGKLINFIWYEKQIYEMAKGKPSLMDVISEWLHGLFRKKKKEYKIKLSEFGLNIEKEQEITVRQYHPVYLSSKDRLDIGHVTDIHLDTRMELYSKSVASVIEVSENCEVRIEDGERVIENKDFYKPIKDLVANFNEFFLDIGNKLLAKSDILVITGDLIDYNKGVHTDQTFGIKDKKPSEVWDELKSNLISLDNEYHQEDRNWFLFYKLLLQLYNEHRKPVFTMLGNHDYVLHAMAPWPLGGLTWNGVYDMNLTRYENALCFGEGYKNSKEFAFNGSTKVKCVEWYTFFINPFPDYVIDYGDQSMFMADWGEGANISKIGGADDVSRNLFHKRVPLKHPGSLHHAANMFREKNEFEQPITYKDENGKILTYKVVDENGNETDLVNPYTRKKMPFLIKNYTIYKSWINRPAAVRMLFTHATGICPRPDISEGEINNVFSWKDPELCYGTFDYRRNEILQDLENGKLHIIVGGHSHRNLVMRVNAKKKDHAWVLGAGETITTDFMEPKNIALVTSSGGPFPTDLPGGPMVCACTKNNKYNTGFYADWDVSLIPPRLKKLYSAKDATRKIPLDDGHCPDCCMSAIDMVRKPSRRHKPGGNLLLFEGGKIKIKSVISNLKTCKTRKAVMCEEQGVFTGDMLLEKINSYRQFKNWYEDEPLRIISEDPFTYYGHMEFPKNVKYVTFNEGILAGNNYKVEPISKEYSNRFFEFIQKDVLNNKYEYRVLQGAVKDSFEIIFIAASDMNDLAFARYSFDANGSDKWDREINIGKKTWEDVKEYAKVHGNNTWEASKDWIAEKFNKKYEPEYKEYQKDDYRGMVLKFRTIPDFKKRKKKNVCGY